MSKPTRHVATKNLVSGRRECAYCAEPWPCLIARGRDALLAYVRGEIDNDEMARRVVRPPSERI